MLRKEMYLPFLLSILLFIVIDNLSYNYIALGIEDGKDDNGGGSEESREDNNEDGKDDNGGEDFEDMSLNELFDDDNNDGDDNTREEKEKEKENKEKDEVPFILPFRAVPFP